MVHGICPRLRRQARNYAVRVGLCRLRSRSSAGGYCVRHQTGDNGGERQPIRGDPAMPKIFISHRRRDSSYETTAIYEELESHFGPDTVFMDVDTIPAGVDFRRYLHDAVSRANAVLVVIGRDWLVDRQGNRRLEDPRDFVRIEVEAALQRGIPVIPILVGEARMPSPDELPASIRGVAYCQCVQVRPRPDFQADVRRLVRVLKKLPEQALSSPAPAVSKRPATEEQGMEPATDEQGIEPAQDDERGRDTTSSSGMEAGDGTTELQGAEPATDRQGTEKATEEQSMEPGESIAAVHERSLGVVKRHTDVSFPAECPVGEIRNLRVQLVPAEEALPDGTVRPLPKSHAHDATLRLEVPRHLEPFRVSVSVAAENFEIEGPVLAELVVPLEGKSNAVNFRLRGLSIGPGRVMVDFTQNGRPVGSVDLTPEVVSKGQAASDEAAPGQGEVCLAMAPGPSPELIVKVFESRFAGSPGQLRFVLFSDHPKLRDLPLFFADAGALDLRNDVASWVQSRLNPLSMLAKRVDASADEIDRTLRNIGHSFYDQLLPKPLQDMYWTLRQYNVRSVMILSDEPHIPWELIKPYRVDAVTSEVEADDPFWGESFALTHWLRGPSPTARFSLGRVCAVAPGIESAFAEGAASERNMEPVDFAPATAAASPPEAPVAVGSLEEELEVIRALEKSGAKVRILAGWRRVLQAVLEEGGFDVLHLVSHGSFGGSTDSDASSVLFEDGPFSAAELTPEMAAVMRKASPLVFFNACETGRLGFTLTGVGSWGARFVQLGCGGFVGTLWAVKSKSACAFAEAFYARLLQGFPIGQAVQDARLEVRKRFPADTTWLAYCCFADPTARIDELRKPVQDTAPNDRSDATEK